MIQNRRYRQSYNQVSLWNKVCQLLSCCRQPCMCSVVAIMITGNWLAKAIFTLLRVNIAFAPAWKPYRIGLLFTHKNGDFGAISVTGRSCAVPSSRLKSHILDRCSHCRTKSIRSFVRSFFRLFVRLFVRSVARSLAHSFTHSLTQFAQFTQLSNSATFRINVKNNSTVKLLEKIQQIVLQKSSFVLVLIHFPVEADINRTVSSRSAFITEFKQVKFKVYSWRRLCLDKVFTSES